MRYRHLHVWAQRQIPSHDTCAGHEEILCKVYLLGTKISQLKSWDGGCLQKNMLSQRGYHPHEMHYIKQSCEPITKPSFGTMTPCLTLMYHHQSTMAGTWKETNVFLSWPSNCLHESRWFISSGVTVWRQNVIQTSAPVAKQNSSVQICVDAVTSGRYVTMLNEWRQSTCTLMKKMRSCKITKEMKRCSYELYDDTWTY